MNHKSKSLIYSLMSLATLGFILFIILLYLTFIPISFSKTPFVLRIPEQSNIHTISTILEENQLIRSKKLFRLYIKITNQATKLRAGSFLVNPSMTMPTICHVLTTQSGSYELNRITIPEGFSLQQISVLLEEKNICIASEFLDYATTQAKKDFEGLYPYLKERPDYTTIEGYLFPETYHFKQNEPIKNIVQTMLKQFHKHISVPFKDQIEKSKLNFNEIMTLASMIEKETRRTKEIFKISSVYHNRLNKGMRLECDPTVVYALGKSYKDRVLYKDLKIKSPYNTYRKKGLPPTPIASPGTLSVEAALNPEKTPYLFFVAKPDGYHHFTRTYKEHLAYQRKSSK